MCYLEPFEASEHRICVLSGKWLAVESSSRGSVVLEYDSEYGFTRHEQTVSSVVISQPLGVGPGAGSFAGGCSRGTRSPVTHALGAAVTRFLWRNTCITASSSSRKRSL